MAAILSRPQCVKVRQLLFPWLGANKNPSQIQFILLEIEGSGVPRTFIIYPYIISVGKGITKMSHTHTLPPALGYHLQVGRIYWTVREFRQTGVGWSDPHIPRKMAVPFVPDTMAINHYLQSLRMTELVGQLWMGVHSVPVDWLAHLRTSAARVDLQNFHNNDVTMSAMTSPGFSTACSTVCLSVHQRKYQSSALLVFVRGIHRWLMDSPHKGPVTREIFPFDDVIMTERNDRQASFEYSQIPIIFAIWFFI